MKVIASLIHPWLFRANTTSAHFGLQMEKRGYFVQRNKFVICISSALKSKQNQRSIGLGLLRGEFTKIKMKRVERRQEKGFLRQLLW